MTVLHKQTLRNTLVDEMSTEFSQWFSGQLKRREWSRSEFVRRSGVPRSTVYTWVAGTRNPDPAAIDRIADVFGLDVDTVLTIAGHRPDVGELQPGDARLEIIGLVKRIDWDPSRLGVITGILNQWMDEDRRKGKQ